jgi:hypothetical protein
MAQMRLIHMTLARFLAEVRTRARISVPDGIDRSA